MWLDNGSRRSQTTGRVWKGAHHRTWPSDLSSWLTAPSMISIQRILTVSLFLSELLPVSAFYNLCCHFLYFIGRQCFPSSCLCNSHPQLWKVNAECREIINLFHVWEEEGSCCVMSSLKFPDVITFSFLNRVIFYPKWKLKRITTNPRLPRITVVKIEECTLNSISL